MILNINNNFIVLIINIDIKDDLYTFKLILNINYYLII